MITETDNKRGRGRPRLGNVMFARRVKPELIPALIDLISKDSATTGGSFVVPPIVKPNPESPSTHTSGLNQSLDVVKLKKQNEQLLADYKCEYDRAEALERQLAEIVDNPEHEVNVILLRENRALKSYIATLEA